MGDVEVWEKSGPNMYMGRRIKANTGGFGRQRGGAGFESLFMIWDRKDYEVQNIGTTKMFTSIGLFGGYPGPTTHTHNLRGTDFLERAQAGEKYAVGDGSYRRAEALRVQRRPRVPPQRVHARAADRGRRPVPLGAQGRRRPGRPARPAGREGPGGRRRGLRAAAVRGVGLRGRAIATRPARPGWSAASRRGSGGRQARERVLAQDFIEPVRRMYAESMRLSPRWAAEYRGFWDLPEDFDFDIITPEVEAEHAAPGKVTPEDVRRRVPRRRAGHPRGRRAASSRRRRRAARSRRRRRLGDMLDGKLSRTAVKDIQSGYKDPDRFDKWLQVLQERVPYGDPIVMPVGEALNVVRTGDGELVIRCDCGHDFCAHDRNWKMEALVFIRDTDELLGRSSRR